jgi:hypothetical protein
VRLRRVFDHEQPAPSRDLEGSDPCPPAWPYKCTGMIALVRSVIACLDRTRVDGESPRIDVDKDRRRPAVVGSRKRLRNKREGHRYDFVTAAYFGGK